MRKGDRQLGYRTSTARHSFSAVPQAFRRPSELTPRSAQIMLSLPSVSAAAHSPYLIQWLRSGGNLDFCLLAVCSCVLTLMCHQIVYVSPASAATDQSTLSSVTKPAEIDFAIKAALFTSSVQAENASKRDRSS